ncbi:MAG: YybS family protein [Alicyclobacillus sp.]|nr:YybS family protein [Alicyclobacillus sp.]
MQPNMPYGRWVARAVLAVGIVLSAVPATAPVVAWLLPVPLMAAAAREPRWISVSGACLSCAALVLGGFGWSAPLFAMAAYFFGWVAGEAIAKSESLYVPLITGTLTFIMLELVQLAFLRAGGIDIGRELARWVAVSVSRSGSVAHLNAQVKDNLSGWVAESVHLILPGALCIMAILLAAVNLTAGRALLGRVGEGSPSLLDQWRLPVWVALVYVLALPALWFSPVSSAPVWGQCLNTVVVVTGFLIGVQGLAYLWRRVSHRRVRRAWLVLMIGIVPVFPLVANLYVLFGLMDVFSGIRRP